MALLEAILVIGRFFCYFTVFKPYVRCSFRFSGNKTSNGIENYLILAVFNISLLAQSGIMLAFDLKQIRSADK